MAVNDIVDVDKMLDDYQANIRQTEAQKQQTDAEFRRIERAKLKEYGFDEDYFSTGRDSTNPYNLKDALQLPTARRAPIARNEAIRAGILADDPFFIENYLQDAPGRVKAEYTGVDYTGGAQGDVIRQVELLPGDVRGDPYYVTKVIQKNYKEDYDIPLTYDYNVRIEPNTGDLIFNDPLNNNKPTVINPPGIQKGDFLAFAEPVAVEIGAAISGGIGTGLLTGGPGVVPGGIISETLATYLWRMQNLNYLEDQGYLPNNYDKTWQAFKDSGMTLLFSLGGVTVFSLLKRLAGVTSAGAGTELLDEDEFMKAWEALTAQGDDVAAMTSPQVIRRAREQGILDQDIGGTNIRRSQEEKVDAQLRDRAEIADAPGEELREKFARQEAEIQESVGGVFDEAGVKLDDVGEVTGPSARAEVGAEVRDVARQALEESPEMVGAEKALTDLLEESDVLLKNISSGKIDPAAAGNQIRDSFRRAKEVAEKEVDDAYNAAYNTAGFSGNAKPYNYDPIEKEVRKILRKLKQGSLQDTSLIKTLDGVLDNIGTGNKSNEIFLRDFSMLRQLIRDRANKGQRIDDLLGLKETFEKVRKDTLSNNPEALDAFLAAEKLNTEKMNVFNNDFTNKFLQEQSIALEAFKTGDKTAFQNLTTMLRNNLSRDPSDPNKIVTPEWLEGTLDSVIFKDEYADSLIALKNGIRQNYYDDVIDSTGERLRPKGPQAHEKFMSENESLVRKLFDEDEIAEFSNADTFIKKFQAREKAFKDVIEQIRKDSNLSNIAGNSKSPEDLFKNTWGERKFTTNKELYEAITEYGSKDLIETYKKYIGKDIMDNTMVLKRGTNQELFNGNKLEKYLETNGDLIELWFGKQFRTNLGKISNKIKAFDDLGTTSLKPEDAFLLRSLNQMARAYVGLFTTPGRIMTAVKNIYGGAADQKLVRLLTRPEELYDTIMKDRWQKDPKLRAFVRELGRIYYREEVDETEFPPDPAEAARSIRLGPGYQLEDAEEEVIPSMNTGGHVVKNLVNLRYGIK
tara:strand:+ start:15868 stop:18936 length:3069 start_codon:yes stop_codon:yes gene_type:complete